jgi:hypothetical protein
MSKICENPPCEKIVPEERESKSDCCSGYCSYELKKLKQKSRYHQDREIIKKSQKHALILANLYQLQEIGVKFQVKHLIDLGFDLGFSTNGIELNGRIAMAVSDYAYQLDEKNNLKIWKLTTSH